jgi:hypothetical protein
MREGGQGVQASRPAAPLELLRNAETVEAITKRRVVHSSAQLGSREGITPGPSPDTFMSQMSVDKTRVVEPVPAVKDQTVTTPTAEPDTSKLPDGGDNGHPGAARPEEDKKYGRVPNESVKPVSKPSSPSTPPASVPPSA